MEYNIYQKFTKEDFKAIKEFCERESNVHVIFFASIFLRILYFTYLSIVGLVFVYLINKKMILIPIICCVTFFMILLYVLAKFTAAIPVFIIKYFLKKNKIVKISNTYFRKGDKKISFEKVTLFDKKNPDYYFFYLEGSPVTLKKEFVPDKLKEVIEVAFIEKEKNKEDVV